MDLNIKDIIDLSIFIMIAIFTTIIILKLNKLNKPINKIKGKLLGNEFEFSGEQNCKEKKCDVEKFNSICFEILDNLKNMLNLDKTILTEQLKVADRKLQLIYIKTCKLLTETASEIGENLDPKTYILFTEILKGILVRMREEIEAVIHEFPYETASEGEYLQFRQRTIESIPGLILERIPDVNLLGPALLSIFLKRFQKVYFVDYAPIIGEIADGIRKLAKDKIQMQDKLKKEYTDIRIKYTGI